MAPGAAPPPAPPKLSPPRVQGHAPQMVHGLPGYGVHGAMYGQGGMGMGMGGVPKMLGGGGRPHYMGGH